MKRTNLVLWYCFFNTFIFPQSSIQSDINFLHNQLFFNTEYVKEIKSYNYKLITGFGNFGYQEFVKKDLTFVNSPYHNSYEIVPYGYKLDKYSSSNYGGTLGVGFGKIWKTIKNSQFHLNFTNQFYLIYDKFSYLYTSNQTGKTTKVGPVMIKHFSVSFSLQFYHYIKGKNKISFYYCLKLPYYTALSKKYYSPVNSNNLMYGFEPTIGLGLRFKYK